MIVIKEDHKNYLITVLIYVKTLMIVIKMRCAISLLIRWSNCTIVIDINQSYAIYTQIELWNASTGTIVASVMILEN